MSDDALTRLEAWLLGDWRYVRLISRSKSETGGEVGAFKPDLTTAIYAALDLATAIHAASTGPRNKDSNTKGKDMGEHALERLEAWLGHPNRYLLSCWRNPDLEIFVCRSSATNRGTIEGEGPDLATAIHAALDRAEEAGL